MLFSKQALDENSVWILSSLLVVFSAQHQPRDVHTLLSWLLSISTLTLRLNSHQNLCSPSSTDRAFCCRVDRQQLLFHEWDNFTPSHTAVCIKSYSCPIFTLDWRWSQKRSLLSISWIQNSNINLNNTESLQHITFYKVVHYRTATQPLSKDCALLPSPFAFISTSTAESSSLPLRLTALLVRQLQIHQSKIQRRFFEYSSQNPLQSVYSLFTVIYHLHICVWKLGWKLH